MIDIYELQTTCYNYFISNQIHNRQQLRDCLKKNKLPYKQVLIEEVFTDYRSEMDKKNKKCKKEIIEKAICINDIHIPFHDSTSLSLVIEIIKQEKPKYLILNGDIIDCYWVSSFLKDPGAKKYLQTECDIFKEIISNLRKFIPDTEIHYIYGNHEDRIKKETWKSPAFYGVEGLTLSNLLDFKKFNIIEHPVSFLLNGLYFTHGNRVSRYSSYSAKLEFETYMVSGISGHTHRHGTYTKRTEGHLYQWYENSCLCTLEPDYIKGVANWQQGFSVIDFYTDWFYIQPVLINDHKFVYNGELFSAK